MAEWLQGQRQSVSLHFACFLVNTDAPLKKNPMSRMSMPVLIVEDALRQESFLDDVLRRAGYSNIEVLRSAADALTLLDTGKRSLVITI